MSKEDKIHEWIEAQNSETKQKYVELLKQEWGLQDVPTPVFPVRKRLSVRKIASICAASFVFAMVALF